MKEWIFFFKRPEKIYCSCYCWNIPWFPPSWDFLVFLFLLSIFCFKKRYREWLCNLKNHRWKCRGLRRKKNGWNGKTKEFTLLSHFQKGYRVDCATGEVRVKVEALGKQKCLKRENKTELENRSSPQEGRRKKTVTEGSQVRRKAETVGGCFKTKS